MAEYCESNGIEISVATADTLGNMPIEATQDHRGVCKELDESRRRWKPHVGVRLSLFELCAQFDYQAEDPEGGG